MNTSLQPDTGSLVCSNCHERVSLLYYRADLRGLVEHPMKGLCKKCFAVPISVSCPFCNGTGQVKS